MRVADDGVDAAVEGRPLEAEGTAAGVALAGEGLALELPLRRQGRQAAVDDHGRPGKNALGGEWVG